MKKHWFCSVLWLLSPVRVFTTNFYCFICQVIMLMPYWYFFVVISSVLRYQVAKFTLGNLSVISKSLFSFQYLFNCLVYQLDFEMFLYLLINICKLTWSFCVWLGGRRYNLWWRNSGDTDKGMCWRSIDTRRTFKSSFLSWLCQVNKVVLKFPF